MVHTARLCVQDIECWRKHFLGIVLYSCLITKFVTYPLHFVGNRFPTTGYYSREIIINLNSFATDFCCWPVWNQNNSVTGPALAETVPPIRWAPHQLSILARQLCDVTFGHILFVDLRSAATRRLWNFFTQRWRSLKAPACMLYSELAINICSSHYYSQLTIT